MEACESSTLSTPFPSSLLPPRPRANFRDQSRVSIILDQEGDDTTISTGNDPGNSLSPRKLRSQVIWRRALDRD